MPISVTCASCKAKLQAPEAASGRKVKCPKCGTPVQVPAGKTATPVLASKAAVQAAPLSAKMDRASVGTESAPIKNRSAKSSRSLEKMCEEQAVPAQYKDAIRKELAEDEAVVWLGRPEMDIRLRKAKIGVLIGVILGAIALGLLGSGIAIGQLVLTLLGGALLPISLLLMFSHYLVKRFADSREVYLVTNRRAILCPSMRSYTRRHLHNKLELRESAYLEGAGSLIFEIQVEYQTKSPTGRERVLAPTRMGPTRDHPGVEKKVTEYGFLDIADVAGVEKLIRNTILRGKDSTVEELDGGAVQAEAEPESPAAESVPQNQLALRQELLEEFEISESIKARALKRLNDDEQVIWVGKPIQKLVLLRSLGMSLICLAIVAAFVALRPSVLMCGAFLIVAAGTPLVRRWRAARTLYVLSKRRAIVWQPNWFGRMTVRDYTPDLLSKMFRLNAWFVKGAGDLVFRKLTQIKTTHYYGQRTGRYYGSRSSITTFYWGFLAINDVAQVEQLINDQLVEPFLNRVYDS